MTMTRLIAAMAVCIGTGASGATPPDLSWTVGFETGDPERGPWTTNYFSSADQDLKVEKTGPDAWRFVCDRFRTHQRTMAVDFVLEVERKGGKTLVKGSVKNCETGTRMFSFDGPYAAAAKVDRGRSKFLYPWSNGTLVQKWPEAGSALGRDGSWGFLFRKRPDGVFALRPDRMCEYPSRRCMMQWFALTDGERTRYFAAKDPKFSAKQAVVEYDPERSTLKFGFNQRFYAHCGETADLAPVEISDYDGDWHKAADDYGAWFTSVRPFARVPDKVRDCSTLMLLLCKQQNGEIVWPYSDFDKLGDTALKYGIRHIKILARGPGGHDNRYPDYWPDPAQGGTNALMKGLAELKKRGIETYAYVNGQLIECGTTEYWRTGGGSTAGVLCRDGRRAHEAWRKYTDRPPHEFDVACPCDRTWLAKMMEVTKEAQYLGFDGMYFDQVAKQWPWQCWAKNHGHRPGDWVWVEDRARYLRGIHDEMVKLDPDFILTSEGYNETVSDSCSISLGLGDSSSIARRFDADAIDYKFPEMAFYAFPRLRTSDRYPSPHRSREQINETAMLGYAADIEVRYPADRVVFEECRNRRPEDYGTVYDKPTWDAGIMNADLAADRDYFKAVNDFRYANREIVLRGDFRDTVGFSASSEAKNHMEKCWVSKDGAWIGVMVWNNDDRPAKFTVSAEGSFAEASEPETGRVDPLSPVPGRSLRLYVFQRERGEKGKAWPVPANPERVREISATLPAKAGFPEFHVSNRAVWDMVAAKSPDAVKSAEPLLKTPVEPIDDADYTNQTKEIWGPISARRFRLLPRLTLAECCENKGRFIGRIVDQLEAVVVQTTWMNPYHDRPAFGNFYGKYRSIDLNVSEAAQCVALAVDCLRGRLPAGLERRLVERCWRECFAPYLATAGGDYSHNGWFFGQSNWNAACHSQTLAAALRLIDDRETRAKFVEGAERGIRAFLYGGGFTREGYCQEGVSYWNYGYGRFLALGLTVRAATAGKVDFFADPKAKLCFTAAMETQLAVGSSPSFGDGSGAVSADNIGLAEIPYPREAKCDYGAKRSAPWGRDLERTLFRCFRPGAMEEDRSKFPEMSLPVRTFFEEAQVYIGRTAAQADDSMSVCIKGGHNGVPHNHNDAGQYVVAVGGVPVVEDPGHQLYDFDTFGPKRYDSKMRNSYGHSVPYLSPEYRPYFGMQKAGREFSAKIPKTKFSEERDFVVLDLSGAYGDSRVKRLCRRMGFDRRDGRVVVEDAGEFSEPVGFQTAITTYGKVSRTDDPNVFTVTREDSRRGAKSLTLRIDAHGAKWSLRTEKIPNPGRTDPTRIGIVFDSPATAACVTVEYHLTK